MSVQPPDEAPANPLSRRAFLQQELGGLLTRWLGGVVQSVERVTAGERLRPPGAVVEPLFLALCTRCDACTAACPHEAISVLYGVGQGQDGTPVLVNLREHPCLLCPDMPCIAACPTGALGMPPAGPSGVKIGTAVLNRLTCSAYRGSGCLVCYDVCPLKDEAIQQVEGLPVVVDDACTGCGICQQACPEAPEAIRVLPV